MMSDKPRSGLSPVAALLGAGLALVALPAVAAEAGRGEPSEAVFVAELVLLLLVGRALGEVMQRLRQPAVVGQLLAGILLGPSVFGLLLPALHHWVFPDVPAQKAMINGVAQLGILMLLLLTGMETDVPLVRRAGRTAFSVSITGIAVPFVCGFALGFFVLPDAILPSPAHRLVTALFLGTALSISSIKIVAIVVREMNFMRRNLGQVIVASAIIDDTIGWIIIAVTFGLARPGGLDTRSLAISIVGTLAFLVLSYTLGRRVVSIVIRWANDNLRSEYPVITAILIIMGVMAIMTDAVGVHTVLGAFVAGVLVGESPILTGHIEGQLRGLITALFMPVFFALAGLGTDITILGNPRLLATTGALILVASVGKFAGAFLGGKIGGLSRRECLALALGMNARGSTEVIVATIGLSIGALNRDLFTMIVTMAVFTTMVMPPTLRWALARLPIGEEEAARLDREAFARNDFVAGLERLLLAADESPGGRFAARVVGLVGGLRGLPTTVIQLGDTAAPPEAAESMAESVEASAEAVRDTVAEEASGTVDVITRKGRAPTEAGGIAEEAAKGYDLTVVGREPALKPSGGFAPEIAAILAELEAPRVVVVARGVLRADPANGPLRILVPVTGSEASRRAAEFAFALARQRDTTVTVLYVSAPANRSARAGAPLLGRPETSKALERGIFAEIEAKAAQQNLRLRTRVRIADAPAEAILRQTRRAVHTLVVLGVSQRPSDTVPFGSTADSLLERSEQTMIFVASEPRLSGRERRDD